VPELAVFTLSLYGVCRLYGLVKELVR